MSTLIACSPCPRFVSALAELCPPRDDPSPANASTARAGLVRWLRVWLVAGLCPDVRVASKVVLDEQASASFDASTSLTAPPGLPALIRCARPAAAPLRRRLVRPAPPLPTPADRDCA